MMDDAGTLQINGGTQELDENCRYFNDWPLALAAYNAAWARKTSLRQAKSGTVDP
ncbi:hypothetical protein MASR2M78_16760 [Treponema sp.]